MTLFRFYHGLAFFELLIVSLVQTHPKIIHTTLSSCVQFWIEIEYSEHPQKHVKFTRARTWVVAKTLSLALACHSWDSVRSFFMNVYTFVLPLLPRWAWEAFIANGYRLHPRATWFCFGFDLVLPCLALAMTWTGYGVKRQSSPKHTGLRPRGIHTAKV